MDDVLRDQIDYEPSELSARLSSLGWDADVGATEVFFYYGSASHG